MTFENEEFKENKSNFMEKYRFQLPIYKLIESKSQAGITEISNYLKSSNPLTSHHVKVLLMNKFIKRVTNKNGINTDYTGTEYGRYMFKKYFGEGK